MKHLVLQARMIKNQVFTNVGYFNKNGCFNGRKMIDSELICAQYISNAMIMSGLKAKTYKTIVRFKPIL